MSLNFRELVRALLTSLEQNKEFNSLDSCTRDMLDKALDRVVDGTDSKISLVPGYKRKLYKSTIKSLQYADSIVEQIPCPINLSSEQFVDNPYLRAFFHTPDGLKKVCSKSSELREFFQEDEHKQSLESCALLCMRKMEENILGMELEGDQVIKDVAQTRVTFSGHRIQSPAEDEEVARRELKCCIFEGLVDNALANISALRARRLQLETEQRVLGSRLRSYSGGVSNKEHNNHPVTNGIDLKGDEEFKLEQVEQELHEIGYVTPETSLDQVNTILDHPEDFVSIKNVSMNLDKGSILKSAAGYNRSISKLDLSEVSIKGRPPRVVTLATIKRDELAAPGIRFPRAI